MIGRTHAKPHRHGGIYGASFWLAFGANLVVSIAVALFYRYADFVDVLGGGELHLGWIVGLGMVGSLATRLALGGAIDRHGPRLVWLSSTVAFVLASAAHVAVGRYDGAGIYLLRVVWASSVAGIFGASTTFIALGAPLVRVAELVGMLGVSGFVGMALGSALGDAVAGGSPARGDVDRLFVWAAALGAASFAFAWSATRNLPPIKKPRRRLPMLWLLRRYQPGMILLVGVAAGIGLGLPQTFLRAYAVELGIAQIGLFFALYCPAAIVTRVVCRRWTARFGAEPLVALGAAGMVASILLLVFVRRPWHLLVPGLGYGIAHALLFPSTVAAGTRTFPRRYRGLATTVVLATWDLGLLIGAPIAGAVLHYAEGAGLPAYPTMFVVVATLMSAMVATYLASGRRKPALRVVRPEEPAVAEDRAPCGQRRRAAV